MTNLLTDRNSTERHELVMDIAAKFATAAGYQLVDSNVNQWVVAVEAMLDGIVQILGEAAEEPTDGNDAS